jgi:hypothetical protein
MSGDTFTAVSVARIGEDVPTAKIAQTDRTVEASHVARGREQKPVSRSKQAVRGL